MVLEEYARELYVCNRCGYCGEMIDRSVGAHRICPTSEVQGFQSYTARGTIHIARAIYERRLQPTKRLSEHFFAKCLLCKNCETHCPLEVDILSVTKALRQDLVRDGLLPDPLKKRDCSVKERHNVFGEDPANRVNWISGLRLSKKSDALYFAGCYDAYRYPENARAAVLILEEAGMNVAYLDEEWCCGLPQFSDGNIILVEENVKHNVDAILASGAKQVITACPGCYTALKSEYPRVVGEVSFEVIHISEIIAEFMDAGKITLENFINKRLTYHDPCHLGRYEGMYDEPRKIIHAIPGIEFVEMRRNRENAWCCGAGTDVCVMNPDLSARIAKMRVQEAEETGAEAIVTVCPQCVTALTPAAKRAKMEVYNLLTIVAKAMGLQHVCPQRAP